MPISVTLDSTACWLLNEPADLSDDVTLELRRRYVAEQGRTALEERRTRQSADVAALKFTLTLEGSWGTAFRAMLRAYDMRPLLVPFWNGLGLVSEISSTLWGSGLRVFFEPDWSHYEIRTDGATAPTSFAASASCCYAPLLWCVFNKLPGDPKALDGETMELQLDLIEAGAAEYALSSTLPILPLYGPTLSTANGLTPRLILPAAADWATAPKLGGIDILYERTQIGCVRQPVEKYAPQDPRRRSTLHLTYSPLELARLLALWQWSDGPVNSWWCEAGYSETTLVAATSSASVEIEVADAAPFATEPYLCLFDGEGLLVGRKIVSIAGNIITLAESPGDIPAEGARVTPLQMVRFSRDTLKIVWKGDLISIEIEVLEQPHETDAGALAGEVLGATIGTLPALRYGYLVTDGTRVWRYTSHDRAINCGTPLGTFVPKPIEHGDITMELNLERHDCDLTVGWWEGCPFFERQTDDAAPVLTVTIYEIEAGAESAAKAIFTGDVVPKYSGDVCSATVRGPEAILDTKIPVQAISRRCWAPLYGAKCGLSRAAMGVLCDVDAVSPDGRSISVRRSGSAAYGALPAGYYAGGYAERSVQGCAPRRFPIVSSSACAASSMLSLSLLGYAPPPEGSLSVVRRYTDNYQVGGFVADAAGNFYVRDDGSAAHRIFRFDPIAGPRQVYLDHGWLSYGMDFDSAGYLYIGDYSAGIVRRVAPGGQSYSDYTQLARPVDIAVAGPDVVYVLSDVGMLRQVIAGVESWTRQLDFSADTPRRLTWVDGLLYIAAGRAIYTYDPASDRLEALARDLPRDVYDLAVSGDHTIYFTVETYDESKPLYALVDGEAIPIAGTNSHLHDLELLPSGRLAIGFRWGWIGTLYASLDMLTLYPGCDKSWGRCQSLGNSDNFRGRPWLPKTNPALVAVSSATSSGSKK